MIQIKEIDEMYDEYIDLFYTKPKIRFKLLHKIDAYFDQKDEEREIKRMEKKGLYGRLLAIQWLRNILKEFEKYDLGYFPELHENVFISEVELDLGPFAKDKKVTSKLYFEPSPFYSGEFVCYDNTGDSIAWIRIGCCKAWGEYSAVVQNDYNAKSEQIIRKQLAEGVNIALEKFLEAGKKNLEELKKMHNIQESAKEAVVA